jgi:hypothetical protein
MFDTSAMVRKVNSLIKLCPKEKDFSCRLPSHDDALGVLTAAEYPLPMDKMKEAIASSNKEKIFKTSCRSYYRDISPEKVREFFEKPDGPVSFTAHYEVNGNYFTRFVYSIHADWLKSSDWVLEKTYTLPGVKQTKGIGGYINDMRSFTIMVPLDANRTLRIFGGWNDIGGKLPMIGEIHATYRDITKTMKDAEKDIREYFNVLNDTVASAPCKVANQ